MEKVLAKPPCSGLSHVCLRCVDLWGNVVFKIHNRALWVFFFLPAAEADGSRGEVVRSSWPLLVTGGPSVEKLVPSTQPGGGFVQALLASRGACTGHKSCRPQSEGSCTPKSLRGPGPKSF